LICLGLSDYHLGVSQQEPEDEEMRRQSIMVVIPPGMSDDDGGYGEVVEYVAACAGFDCIRDNPDGEDSVSCDAYFRDDKGNIWHGQLCNPPYPDGSQKYIVGLEKKAGQ